MKEILVSIRDFCFVLLAKKHSVSYAQREYKFLFGLIFTGYYIAILGIIGILQYKSGIKVPPYLKGNIFISFIGGIIMFSPFYIFMRFLLSKLSDLPVDQNMADEKYKQFILITTIIFFGGMILAGLVPWALDSLL